MPGCITGTSVQNVCSAESPADIRATTLMVTTSEMPPLLVVSPRQCEQNKHTQHITIYMCVFPCS